MSSTPPPGRLLVALLGGVGLALLLGCHALHLPILPGPAHPASTEKEAGPAAPGKFSLRVSQYVFLSDFELKKDLPLFDDLSELRDQVYRELQLPASNTVVQVFLFEDRTRYDHFMHTKYPKLPSRRAFFVAPAGGGEDLYVYTYWGDRLVEDLRHELTHALLHSVLQDVPLWLDEGLAEYFQLPPENHGVNPHHLEQLGGDFKPDLARLEGLDEVKQMSPAEYREAWAWVHLMLRSRPEARQVLLAYLMQMRSTRTPGPLRPLLARVFPSPENALTAHLAQLQQAAGSNPRAQR